MNTIESESKQERILARRERIQTRIGLKNGGSKAAGSHNNSHNMSNTNSNAKTIETSLRNPATQKIEVNTATEITNKTLSALNEYINQGQSILADVKVASMSHESNRRNEQEKQQHEMVERLNFEAKVEEEKFRDIADKWILKNSGLNENKINPSDLYLLLNDQNEKCKTVINDKNRLIGLLKEVARTAEDRYVKDLKRENDDVELISKRMEDHVKEMTVKFQASLNKIQEALVTDRNSTNQNAQEKSEKSWKARSLREIEMVYQAV